MEQRDVLDLIPDPSAPNREAEEHSFRLWQIEKELRAAADSDLAYYGSCALYQLHLAATPNRSRRISLAQANTLIEALEPVVVSILALFPDGESRVLARDALHSAVTMIHFWVASGERRESMPADTRSDMIDRVRWLRNALHNISLTAQIRERAARRSTPALRELSRFAQTIQLGQSGDGSHG